jgi:hypothetical protein
MKRLLFGVIALLLLAGSVRPVEAIPTTHERSGSSRGEREGAGIGDDDIPTKTGLRIPGGVASREASPIRVQCPGFQRHPETARFSVKWFLELIKVKLFDSPGDGR